MRNAIKILLANILLLGALIAIANFISISIIQIYNWNKPKQYAESHLFPNYKDNRREARTHFTEYDSLTKGRYEAYYGWRRPAMAGQTINIDDNGLRLTYVPQDLSPNKMIAFFGGSTMWGTGAGDFDTIPSFFAKKMPNFRSVNFGETGYTTHQSLNFFMKDYYEGFRPDIVVSYDGVNDTWTKCRRELDVYSHSRESFIRIMLEEGSPTNSESFLFLVLPVMNFIEKINRVLTARSHPSAQQYDCHDNPEKAENVARFLLQDWMVIKTLVESYGGEFIAILQPHAYVSNTKLDHLKLDEVLGWQYKAVYPKVIDLLNQEFPTLKNNFVDLRHALDREGYFYIDWCHLSPNGNEIIASRIVDVVQQRYAQNP